MKIDVINGNTICVTAENMLSAEEIRQAFVSCGIPPVGEIHVAVFVGKRGVLLMATITKPRAVYRFENLEHAIGGAQEICDACESHTTLYYYDGAYFLSLDEDFPRLSEFGRTRGGDSPRGRGAAARTRFFYITISEKRS